MNPQLEYRSALEVRAAGDRLTGYAVVFHTRSRDLGGFCEMVAPSAVDRSLTGDVVALFDHKSDHILGRTPKTLQLRKDDRGLAFELDPAPTTAGREAVELVRRGDLSGASFGFRTLRDAWSNGNGLPVRELLDIEIVEISLTAFPAYRETDAAVAKRSLQAFQAQRAGQSIRWLRMREESGLHY